MSKIKPRSDDVASAPAVPQPEASKRLLPAPLLIAFGVVILAGCLVGFTRKSRLQSTLYEAMDKCDAETLAEVNGITDSFGIVRITSRQETITKYLSLCEQDPELARTIFRQALSLNSKSAKLVALYSSFFLAVSNTLQAQDIATLAASLDPAKETAIDVRRTAQRALADLIFINDTLANQAKWHDLPAGLKDSTEGPSHRIQTREEKLRPSAKQGLGIRWSNPDLAHAWWTAHQAKGNWDSKLQRYVIEAVTSVAPGSK